MVDGFMSFHPKVKEIVGHDGRIPYCPMCRVVLDGDMTRSQHLKCLNCPWNFTCWASTIDDYVYGGIEFKLEFKDSTVSVYIEYLDGVILVRPIINDKVNFDKFATRIPMFDVDLTDMLKFQNKIRLYLTFQ